MNEIVGLQSVGTATYLTDSTLRITDDASLKSSRLTDIANYHVSV